MDQFTLAIQNILKEHIWIVEKTLRKLCEEEYPQAMIHSGAWANPRIVTAYVSFFPDDNPSANSIDFMMQLMLSESKAEFQADIAYSSGELIAEVLKKNIKFNNEDELISKVTDQGKKISTVLLQKVGELHGKGVFATK